MMTEGTLRMQPLGQWAIAAPGREPVPIVAGEVFRLQVRTARGKFMRVRMEHADDRWWALLDGGSECNVALRDGLRAGFYDQRERYAKALDP
jgi:hypothetical protein